MESLLTLWENRMNNCKPVYETCKRCKKERQLIEFYDQHHKRTLCKVCRDYNKIYCKKYFHDCKKLNTIPKDKSK